MLGLECAGVISKVGEETSLRKPGERVMALLAGGGYAEQVVVPEQMVISIPEHLSFEAAAAIPEAFLTAREALVTCARLDAGETVLVHAAASGVGSAVIQLAQLHGARVFSTASTPEKQALALSLGAECCIDYRTQDFVSVVQEKTEGRGVDVIIDFIGAAYAEKHAACLAPAGRHVVVGLLGGSKIPMDLAHLLTQRHSLHGLVMRTRSWPEKIAFTRAFIREQLPFFRSQRLKPVIDSVFSLADAHLAHTKMETNANIGKIVLKVRD